MRPLASAVLWVLIYLLLVAAPLLVLLLGPVPPLDGVGSRRDTAALRDWILATGAAEADLPTRVARVKQKYRALSTDELDALLVYMQSLRD